MLTPLIEPPRERAGDLSTLTRGTGSATTNPIARPRFRWGTRIVLPAVVLACALALLAFTAKDTLWPPRQVRVVPVVVRTGVEPTAAVSIVQATGWVEPDPYPISVSALTDGVVREVLVLEGERVERGQVVARLVDDDARIAKERAGAQLLQARAVHDAAQKHWDNPIERNRAVAAAEAMVAETQAELTKLTSDVAAESAKAAELAEERTRVEKLAETNQVGAIELIQARRRSEAQDAKLAATKAQRPVLEQQLRQREAELKAAQENLRLRIEESRALAEASAAVDAAEAAFFDACLRYGRTDVRAPAGGVLMARLVQPGSKVILAMDAEHSAHVARMYDPARLQVRADVPLGDAAKVSVGQRAKIVVHVLPDRTFDGVVTRIVNEADIQKNTLQAKVQIEDPSSQLKPEMLARVKFLAMETSPTGAATRPAQLIFAPEQLIRRDGGATRVWVVDSARGVATLREVQLGQARREGWVSVASGLMAGDQLIADAGDLKEGQKVKVIGEASIAPAGQPGEKGGGHGVH